MAYKALDIARYIINYSNEEAYGVSNLKLQKLLYFVQAAFLVDTEEKEPCFLEDIEAWGFGPVVPCVYHEFKRYGGNNIPRVDEYLEVNDSWEVVRKTFDSGIIKAEDQETIKSIIDDFSNYSATALVNITHNQAPWKDAYQAGVNRVITRGAIQKYFE